MPAEHTALRFGLLLSAPGMIGLIGKVLISSLQEPAAAGISHTELISVPITPLSDTDAAAEMPAGSVGLCILAGNSTGRENPALSLGEHQVLFYEEIKHHQFSIQAPATHSFCFTQQRKDPR